MNRNPDPYDDDREFNSRSESTKSMVIVMGLFAIIILLLAGWNLGLWIAVCLQD